MRLLVTRPIDDAEPLAERLHAMGHTILLAPVLEIQILAGIPLPLEGVQAVLATSANGVRAFAHASHRRDLPLFAVGPATARAARAAGFGTVERGSGGDAPALAAHIVARLSPANGSLLHAAGNVVRGDFQTTLEAHGFRVRRVVLYRAEPVARLDDGAEQAIGAGGLDGVLLHSPRSAREFVRLVAQARLSGACAELTAYCLSHEVAKASTAVAWRTVHIAARPDQEALLALLASAPAPTSTVER